MAPLRPGARAPTVPGAPGDGAWMAFFYKVTCPTCQMAAPVVERLHRALPGRVVGVGQDPEDRLVAFAEEHETSFPSVSDAPDYPVSDAYRVRTVPTLFLVEDGAVTEEVESWSRDAWNGIAARLAGAVGQAIPPLSTDDDALPETRPG